MQKLLLILFVFVTQALWAGDPIQTLAPGQAERAAVSRVEPAYPPTAKSMKLNGTAVVEVTIAPDGTVKAAKGISGHALFVASSLSAVRKWKFRPFQLNGEAIAAIGTIEFKFAL